MYDEQSCRTIGMLPLTMNCIAVLESKLKHKLNPMD